MSMGEHQKVRNRVRVLEMLDELAHSPDLTATMFHELSKRLIGKELDESRVSSARQAEFSGLVMPKRPKK